jgi:hypothetical protein
MHAKMKPAEAATAGKPNSSQAEELAGAGDAGLTHKDEVRQEIAVERQRLSHTCRFCMAEGLVSAQKQRKFAKCSSIALVRLVTNPRSYLMRRPLFSAVAAVVVLAAVGPNSAAAQDYPYCLQGKDWGYPGLCYFWSYQQCLASASGTLSYCGINPRYAFARPPRYWRPYY